MSTLTSPESVSVYTEHGISLRGVTKRFGAHAAVAGVDLDIARGEFFTMLGPSGSGKTTLLRLIAGFEVPDEGTIFLRGVDVTRTPPYQRGVNTVFQDYALFPHFTVAENVAYGLRVRRVARPERATRVEAALAMVQMNDYAGRKPAQLSGGQRQRVALARAIVNEPEVLLLDEPLGALDLKLRQEMQVELKRIQRQVGITFIYVTHDQEEALTMSDRLAVFRDGHIEQVGQPADVYEHPATEFVAWFVGTSNVIDDAHGPRRPASREARAVGGPGAPRPVLGARAGPGRRVPRDGHALHGRARRRRDDDRRANRTGPGRRRGALALRARSRSRGTWPTPFPSRPRPTLRVSRAIDKGAA